MIDVFKNNSVFAIPPSYDSNQNLDLFQIETYLNYLSDGGANIIMTTAGSSQFNLLSLNEVRDLNNLCYNKFEGIKILGVPAMSLGNLKNELYYYNNIIKSDKVYLLLIYPERFYSNQILKNFFTAAARVSKIPLMFHGIAMRNGIEAGNKQYTPDLINQIISSNDKIVGMKEECSTFELAYDLIRNIDKEFINIVAGKSIRRFELLKNVGATTFVSGVGSLFPKFEIEYFYNDNKLPYIYWENEFFDIFMKYGWHKCMRGGIKILGKGCKHNRQPFPSLTLKEKKLITNIINKMTPKFK